MGKTVWRQEWFMNLITFVMFMSLNGTKLKRIRQVIFFRYNICICVFRDGFFIDKFSHKIYICNYCD